MMMRTALRRWLSLLAGAASLPPGRAGIVQRTARDVRSAAPAWTAATPRSQPRSGAPNAPSVLQWRAPCWACLMASWLLGTVIAPTFWLTGILLAIDSRSDHPAFWPSLMGIVAFVNAMTIVRINQRQHRQAYVCREALARHYRGGMSQRMGAVLFLVAGWGSGFLQDITLPAAQDHASLVATATAVMWSMLLAWLFSLGSFTHVGVIHARVGFVYRRRFGRRGPP